MALKKKKRWKKEDFKWKKPVSFWWLLFISVPSLLLFFSWHSFWICLAIKRTFNTFLFFVYILSPYSQFYLFSSIPAAFPSFLICFSLPRKYCFVGEIIKVIRSRRCTRKGKWWQLVLSCHFRLWNEKMKKAKSCFYAMPYNC